MGYKGIRGVLIGNKGDNVLKFPDEQQINILLASLKT